MVRKIQHATKTSKHPTPESAGGVLAFCSFNLMVLWSLVLHILGFLVIRHYGANSPTSVFAFLISGGRAEESKPTIKSKHFRYSLRSIAFFALVFISDWGVEAKPKQRPP